MKSTFTFFLVLANFSICKATTEAGFIENKGQWQNEIKFVANIPGGNMIIKSNSIEYFFYDTKAFAKTHNSDLKNSKTTTVDYQVVRLKFKNANPTPILLKTSPKSEKYNYFLGNDPSRWKSGVSAYSELIFKELYPHIDFRIYNLNGVLKTEYIVGVGGNPTDISLNYDGIKNLEITPEEVLIETDINVFKEINPFTFQRNKDKQIEITTHFIKKNNSLSFEIGKYDATIPLIIDPELVFSTYTGSSSDNWSHTATYDSKGNLYAGGSVFGSSYLITSESFQTQLGGATSNGSTLLLTDIVINKYDTKNGTLLYATFLGGRASEVPHSLIVNSKDELIIYGTTSSLDFPVSSNAFDNSFGGGISMTNRTIITSNIAYQNGSDIIVAVLSENGDKLLGSTFLGGNNNDGINNSSSFGIRNYGDEFRGEVVTDENDFIYIASTTLSTDFPVTNSSKLASDKNDAVVLKLSPYCDKLSWSTYLGGLEYEAATGIRVNIDKSVFVTGVTQSSGLGNDKSLKKLIGGLTDGFVAKLNNGNLQSFTYLGTDKEDLGLLIDIDKNENIYVLGLSSGNYPVSSFAYRNENSGQFIQCLSNDLSTSIFSTVFGAGRSLGFIDIVPTAFLVNDCSNIYVAGWGGKVNVTTGLNLNSTTNNLPTTRTAFKRTTSGSNYYLMILEANARSLLFGSFFGSELPPLASEERGDHLDGGTCRFDKKGIIYHSACVCKANNFVGFPLKNPVSASHNSSNCNMAAFKFDIESLSANFSYSNGSVKNATEYCTPSKLSFQNESKNAVSYEWFVNDTLVARIENLIYNFPKEGKYKIKLKAYNSTLCISSDSVEKELKIIGFYPKASADTTICASSTVKLISSGGNTYEWSPSSGLSRNSISNPVAKLINTTTYSVKITNGICSETKQVKITVDENKSDFSVNKDVEICKNDSVLLQIKGNFISFEWNINGRLNTINKEIWVKPTQTTSYKVKALYADGCVPSKEVKITIDETFEPKIDFELDYDCEKLTTINFVNRTAGENTYTWNLINENIATRFEPNDFKNLSNSGKNLFVNVSAKNKAGCNLNKTFEIPNSGWTGQIPNIITPNNDGLNDNLVLSLPNLHLKIYNRLGKEIFNDNDYKNNWGRNIENGTYFYILKLPNQKQCKGYIDVFK